MIIKRDFTYSKEKKNRPLHIYLPDNYYETEERYPVMYFFDGHNLFFNEDATYGKSWGMKEFLSGWPKNMIIVGIECGHGEGERLSEYLPYPAEHGSFMKFEPKGDETLKWIIEEIKPVIDRDYRTYDNRQCTAIGGSSMGGLMALYGATRYNQIFSKAACVSSSIGICLTYIMNEIYRRPVDPDTRIYLSWGTKEAYQLDNIWEEDRSSKTYQWNARVAKKLEKEGAAVKMVSQVGGGHCEADWEKLVPDFMDFLWVH